MDVPGECAVRYLKKGIIDEKIIEFGVEKSSFSQVNLDIIIIFDPVIGGDGVFPHII